MNAVVLLVACAGAAVTAAVVSGVLPRPGRVPIVTATSSGPASRDATAAFEQASRDLRAGLSSRHALSNALHRHPGVLPQLRQRLDADASLADALHQLDVEGDEQLFVRALQVSLRTDAHPADVMDRAALIVRERAAWRHERHSQAAQARLSARLLTLLPLAFAAWSTATSARVREAELHQPAVLVCLVLGGVLNLIGWWWMRHLVRGGSP